MKQKLVWCERKFDTIILVHSSGVMSGMLASRRREKRGCRWPVIIKQSTWKRNGLPNEAICRSTQVCNDRVLKKLFNKVTSLTKHLANKLSLFYGKTWFLSFISFNRWFDYFFQWRNTSSSSYVTVINVGPFQETVNLKQLSSNIPNVLKCAIVSTTSAHEIGWDIKIKIFICIFV